MDLINFLQPLVASDGAHVAAAAAAVGIIVFGIVNYLDAQFNLPADVKFWGSMALAYVLPFAAYFGLQALSQSPVDLNGLFLAASVGWVVSQGIRRVQQAKKPVVLPPAA